jgi:hypothetical protein
MTNIANNQPATTPTKPAYGRRDALKLGGLSISAAAFLAACGAGRSGSDTPGRVGFAPPIEELVDYPITDAVLLRTASSLELTAIAVYEAVLDTGLLDAELTTLVERLIEDHQMIADEMGQLTESVGGVAWDCTNPWYMERTVTLLLAAVIDSDNPVRDLVNTAVTIENIAAATHQTLAIQLTDADASLATLAAAKLESRHSAYIVAIARGPEGYVNPLIDGDGDIPLDPEGVPHKFSITNRFGSTGQVELVAGAPNENGVRQTFIIQTPSLNSWIYEELEPTC